MESTKSAWLRAPVVGLLVLLASGSTWAQTFSPGDVFISLKGGEVQWRRENGALVGTLIGSNTGPAHGMGFDASGNLYVTHWCVDGTCLLGNTVDRFNTSGVLMGTFGTGYNCNPNSIAFDTAGNAHIGQADCTADVLKLNSVGLTQAAFDAAVENRGSNWIDLAPDGCTIFYTSEGPSVKRFNVCADSQMANLTSALPGGGGHALKILPGGDVLVANDSVIARLNASGTVVQEYDVALEPNTWTGLDLAGDAASFWVTNLNSGNVFRIRLSDGVVLASFNASPLLGTVKSVAVVRPPSVVSSRGRMTGGGFIFLDDGTTKVTHGFELHCSPTRKPNNFEVNTHPAGEPGHKFHLDQLNTAVCTDDPSINPMPPAAPFDTYDGTGTGKWDNQPGYTADWTLTDAGEPGRDDEWRMTIRDPNGNVVLAFTRRRLDGGNHQAHK